MFFCPRNLWSHVGTFERSSLLLFSVTNFWRLSKAKISIYRAFSVSLPTEHRDQVSLCSFTPHEVSVLAELVLGHQCCSLTDIPIILAWRIFCKSVRNFTTRGTEFEAFRVVTSHRTKFKIVKTIVVYSKCPNIHTLKSRIN